MNTIRFEYKEHTDTIWFQKDDGLKYQLDAYNLKDCVKVLNTLAEANQNLYKENEELKKDLNTLLETIQRNSKYYDHQRFEKPTNAGNIMMYVKIEKELASIGRQLETILKKE